MMKQSPLRALRASLLMVCLGAAALTAPSAVAQTAACGPIVIADTPPPPLPSYEQPPIPGPGYIWSPGYWSWDPDESDYYWVPGTWALPPRPGLLWTPGYWAWIGGQYLFHDGYWGPHVGFYGGISYGFGYTGVGYGGGRWDNGVFFYNRTVNNLAGANITNVYNQTVVVNNEANRASFNGGRDGTTARPTSEQRSFGREDHFASTPLQQQHAQVASKDPSLFNKANQGKPPVAATAKPAEFKGAGVTSAAPTKGGEQKPLPPMEMKSNVGSTPSVGQPAVKGVTPAAKEKTLGTENRPLPPGIEENKLDAKPKPVVAPEAKSQVERPIKAAPVAVARPPVAGRPPSTPQGKKKEEKKKSDQ
jgi:WXXGXW repeat (2 copies)